MTVRIDVEAERQGQRSGHGRRHRRHRSHARPGDAQHQGARQRSEQGAEAASRHVRERVGGAAQAARTSWPCRTTAVAARARTATRVFVVEPPRTTRAGKATAAARSRASSSCGSARTRGDFVAVLDGVKAGPGGGRPPAPSSCATARRVVVNNKAKPDARSSAPRPRTAEACHEAHRHLHPAAGAGDRRQPGHHHRRPAGDALAERAPVPEARERDRHRAHALRGRQRRSGARLHHHAARARDRRRRRHRLHRVAERRRGCRPSTCA